MKHSPSESTDPREMAHYDRLAATWWDPDGPFWPLHGLNRFRVQYLRTRLIEHFHLDDGHQPLEGLSILDIGCGGGILSESMARLGARVTGIDPVARNIAIAEDHAEASGLVIDYRCETVEAHEAPSGGYDAVLNMEVVEHVEGLPGFLHACARQLRPGGVMFVATINRTPLAGLTAIFAAEYILRWLPRGTHQYRKLRRPAEVRGPLADSGLEVVHQTGVAVSPITRRFRYTRSLTVNYMMTAVKSAA
ncbi:bifunctional 2-polyprenyl-6-hydroxyphenol methylase/3-demethylubiquinol 3-O-methyltransferase UbiG [Spiribacter onubensis]|uniref:Ubiquinone biosynthesis O-methyltransferase n=1 Tax=Spiribacter onubensis TaxID=3122420 RepID=A0ABV3S6B2_9GAMM